MPTTYDDDKGIEQENKRKSEVRDMKRDGNFVIGIALIVPVIVTIIYLIIRG